MTDEQRQILLAGTISGALIQALRESAKEIRRYAGSGADKSLQELEARAVLAIKNATLDGIPENDQLLIIKETRDFIVTLFRELRGG